MRSPVVAVALSLIVVACSPAPPPGPSPEPLAADQTLSLAVTQDVADFDPAMVSSPADVDILRNLFSGPYRFDVALHEVPDIAARMPDVSADGLVYTFHLRTDARFSNGDPITADDFLYSWNRAAAAQGDYAGLLAAVAGYQAVAAGTATQMSGLAKVDDSTFTATLAHAAPSFTAELALPPFWLVDRNVIASAGSPAWATAPDTLVGSGPFRMTARTPGRSMDFAPVAGWYGGRGAGRLTRVHVQVVADPDTAVAAFDSGSIGVYGYARAPLTAAAAARIVADPKLKARLTVVPLGVTTWAGFNLRAGPFAGLDAGRAGRHAFSTAIDRGALADAVCSSGTLCAPATGGLISKGLTGFLGDGKDTNATFDPAKAKAEYQAWDPTGARVKGLTYTYDSGAFNKAVCANLQAQWRKNLGVDVGCVELDRKTFFAGRDGACAYPMFRDAWAADYDEPAAWFGALFVTGGAASGACYSNPGFDKMVGDGNYVAAGYLLVQDSVFAALLYGSQPYLIQPYVKGAGGNALYDFIWNGIRILRH